ncbi:hypothetical protein [Brevundimonas poindexterae]|uniref:hypothetical protein n=1 Tax=Brevundimonas poindexterae TaxID=74325 RepID=UPI001CFD6F39|nr:hypothetical protein [Brevundimonas poindexterae]
MPSLVGDGEGKLVFSLPWEKSRTVRCPDGTTREVFKKLDDAFPLSFKAVTVKAKANVNAAQELGGEVAGQYEDKISELMFRIDEYNASTQSQLRAAYTVYAASPCTHIDYLARALDTIRDREDALRRADATVRMIVSAIEAFRRGERSAESVIAKLGDNLAKALDFLGDPPSGQILVNEMSSIEDKSAEWRL